MKRHLGKPKEGHLREPPFPISVLDEIDGHEVETKRNCRRRCFVRCFQGCHHAGDKGLWSLPPGLTSDAPNFSTRCRSGRRNQCAKRR